MSGLPELIMNRAFMEDFSEAPAPCFGMGLVEANGAQTGFLAIRPATLIPGEILGLGFAFGHRMLDLRGAQLCQFVFNIYGFQAYSVLVNPASPMVRTVLEVMLTRRDYFFFVLNPDGGASAFRSDLGVENIAGLRDNLLGMYAASTSPARYEEAAGLFAQAPDPASTVLTWVCRDNPDYIDLDTDPMVLPPSDR
ncbi:MAG: hypothetical protein ACJAVT_000567 [Yoonia sp.]|jgi:hypothetical protein